MPEIVKQAPAVGIHVVEIRQRPELLERKYITESEQTDEARLQKERGHLEPANKQTAVNVEVTEQTNQLQIKKTETTNLPLVRNFTELSTNLEKRLIAHDQYRWGHREYVMSQSDILASANPPSLEDLLKMKH